ncbi:MAG: VWA domain-containing protein [Phyllobacterium sp.]
MIEGFSFASPWAFLAFPLPLLATWLLKARREPARSLTVPSSVVYENIDMAQTATLGDRHSLTAILWTVWALGILALAGPQIIQPVAALPISGRDIVLALDLSGSMERKDFSLDGNATRRIEVVKEIGAKFLRGRSGDRVGLVMFADEPFLAAAPTFDLSAVETALRNVGIGMVGRSTAIGDGLGLSLKILRRSPAHSRVVILLSDGANTAGAISAESAAQLAKTLGIKVHTIMLGTDLDENVSSATIAPKRDTVTLADIAKASGGESFLIKTNDDLRKLATSLDSLETSSVASPSVLVTHNLWPYPAGLAMFLCLVGFFAARRAA